MRLLGTNNESDLAKRHNLKSYYKRPCAVSADKKRVEFSFKRMPKYQFVTVPENTRYDEVVIHDANHPHMMEFAGYLKHSKGKINFMDFEGIGN